MRLKSLITVEGKFSLDGERGVWDFTCPHCNMVVTRHVNIQGDARVNRHSIVVLCEVEDVTDRIKSTHHGYCRTVDKCNRCSARNRKQCMKKVIVKEINPLTILAERFKNAEKNM